MRGTIAWLVGAKDDPVCSSPATDKDVGKCKERRGAGPGVVLDSFLFFQLAILGPSPCRVA
jgi:hypothetical protein